jgi:cytochrome P450
MRLHASIGFALERVVPTGGAKFEGHFLPAGTKVGCNPRVIHRDEGVYGADAAVFNPDRYLNASAEQKREMEAVSLRWGGGIRKCPGEKMALVAMAKFMTVFFNEFDVELLEEPELKNLGLDGQEEEVSFATTKWKGTWMKLTKLS